MRCNEEREFHNICLAGKYHFVQLCKSNKSNYPVIPRHNDWQSHSFTRGHEFRDVCFTDQCRRETTDYLREEEVLMRNLSTLGSNASSFRYNTVISDRNSDYPVITLHSSLMRCNDEYTIHVDVSIPPWHNIYPRWSIQKTISSIPPSCPNWTFVIKTPWGNNCEHQTGIYAHNVALLIS